LEFAFVIIERLSTEEKQPMALGSIVKTFSKITSLPLRSNLFTTVLELASEIVDERLKCKALTFIVKALSEEGEIPEITIFLKCTLEIMLGLRDCLYKDETLSSLAIALSLAGDYHIALKVVSGICFWDVKTKTLVLIVKAFLKADDILERMDIFYHLLEITSGIESDHDKANVLVLIVKAFPEAVDVTKYSSLLTCILEIALEINNEWRKSKILGSIAKTIARFCDIPERTNLFSRVLIEALAIREDSYKADALKSIAKAFFQAGEVNRSKEIFTLALETASGICSDSEKAETLGVIAKALFQAGEVNHSKEIFTLALETASGICSDSEKAETLGVVSKALFHAGAANRSNDVFSLALKVVLGIADDEKKAQAFLPVAKSLSCVGAINRSKETFNLALEVLSKIKYNGYYKIICLHSIVETLLGFASNSERSNLYCIVLKITSGFRDDNEKVNILESILKSLSQAGEFFIALEVASGIANNFIKTDALKAIAEAIVEARNIRERIRLLFTVIEAASGIGDNYKSDVHMSVAKSFSIIGEFNLALEIASGIVIDSNREARALGAIAEAIAEARNIPENIRLLFIVVETVSRIEDNYKSIVLVSVAKSLLIMGECNLALEVASEIANYCERANALSAIAEAGEMDLSINAMVRALETASGFNGAREKPEALISIGKFLLEAGETDLSIVAFIRALEAASGVGNEAETIKALVPIVKGFAKYTPELSSPLVFALDLVSVIENDRNKADALVWIAMAFFEAGEISRSKETFANALTATLGINAVWAQAGTLGTISKALSEASLGFECSNLFTKTIEIASGIDDEYCKSRAMQAISEALSEASLGFECTKLFTQLIEIVSGMEYDGNITASLQSIVEAFSEIACRFKCTNITSKALEVVSRIENDYAKTQALRDMVKPLVRAQELSSALNIALNLGSDFAKAEALGNIAEALCKTGENVFSLEVLSGALKTALLIKKDCQKSQILVRISVTFWDLGEGDRAKKTLDFALASALGIEDFYLKALALVRISKGFSTFGERTDVMEMLDLASGSALGIEDYKKTEVMSLIAKAFSEEGKFSRALEVVLNIESEETKTETLQLIIKDISQVSKISGHLDFFISAFNVIYGIGDDSYKVKVLELILPILVFNKLPLLFEDFLSNALWSSFVWKDVIPTWQEALLNTKQPYLPLLRRSLGYYAFHGETAYGGVFRFLSGLYKAGKIDEAEAIIRYCPQLEMDFLLPKLQSNEQTYSNLNDWLDDLEDEDIQGKIAIWARKVDFGKMTDKEFNVKVLQLEKV